MGGDCETGGDGFGACRSGEMLRKKAAVPATPLTMLPDLECDRIPTPWMPIPT